jgi:hypothetical protein
MDTLTEDCTVNVLATASVATPDVSASIREAPISRRWFAAWTSALPVGALIKVLPVAMVTTGPADETDNSFLEHKLASPDSVCNCVPVDPDKVVRAAEPTFTARADTVA